MLCDDEIEEFLLAFTVEKGKKKRACIKQTLFFDLTQPVWVATNKISRYVVPSHNFNLTQPVWVATRMGTIHTWTFQSNATARVATAELHNRRNTLLFILRNICLFFYPIQWSYIIYCNGITSFHFMKANKNTVTS